MLLSRFLSAEQMASQGLITISPRAVTWQPLAGRLPRHIVGLIGVACISPAVDAGEFRLDGVKGNRNRSTGCIERGAKITCALLQMDRQLAEFLGWFPRLWRAAKMRIAGGEFRLKCGQRVVPCWCGPMVHRSIRECHVDINSVTGNC